VNAPHPDTTETDPDEIMLDLVARWHDGAGAGRSLAEYLGLSLEDYAAWVELRATCAETVAKMATRRDGGGP
jgi:hypothetical protein